jgi:coiled-coil domain-containing protein 39
LKERQIEQFERQVQEHNARIKVMREHLKNVQQELSHAQQMHEIKNKEIETERHLAHIADKEYGRVVSDVRKNVAKSEEAQDRLNSIQNDTFLANEKLEQFQRDMNWNQEELLQWTLAAKQKDEDQEVLDQYKRRDDVKMKQLVLQLENMTAEVVKRKADVDREVTETKAIQIELDKTAEEYRRLHEERQRVIAKWDEAERAVQRRDNDIAQAGERLIDVKLQAQEKTNILQEQKHFLEQEKANNKQVELDIAQSERVLANKRSELHKSKDGINEIQDEVQAMRNELQNATSELNKMTRTLEALKEQKVQRVQALADNEAELKDVHRQLDDEQAKSTDLNERARRMEKLHAQHEAQLRTVELNLTRTKEIMFRKSRELFDLRAKESQLIAQIGSFQGISRNLRSRIHDLDQRSLKQQEMLYTIEFQVQQMERKVSFAQGKRTIEETVELNQQISELKEQLEAEQQQYGMLNGQVKKLQEDLRGNQRRHADMLEQINKVKERIGQLDLEIATTTGQMRDVSKRRDELVVQHDVLKLEIRQLEERLHGAQDDVLELEHRKQQFEISRDEREQEINMHREIQLAEAKMAEEARHHVARDMKERQVKMEKLKQKYGVIAGRMASSEVPEEEQSQAFFIIRAAQEREELQRKGDKLNDNIKQLERKLRQLNNALHDLHGRNQVYRESFHTANPNDPDIKLRDDLDNQKRVATKKLFERRRALRTLQDDYQKHTELNKVLQQQLGDCQAELSALHADSMGGMQSVTHQKEALMRAEKAMKKRTRLFKKRKAEKKAENDELDAATTVELHMELQMKRSKNKAFLKLLGMFASSDGRIGNAVDDVLSACGLGDFSRPSTASSSISDVSLYSVASSVQSNMSYLSSGKLAESKHRPDPGSPTFKKPLHLGQSTVGYDGDESVPSSSAASPRSPLSDRPGSASSKGSIRKGLPSRSTSRASLAQSHSQLPAEKQDAQVLRLDTSGAE